MLASCGTSIFATRESIHLRRIDERSELSVRLAPARASHFNEGVSASDFEDLTWPCRLKGTRGSSNDISSRARAMHSPRMRLCIVPSQSDKTGHRRQGSEPAQARLCRPRQGKTWWADATDGQVGGTRVALRVYGTARFGGEILAARPSALKIAERPCSVW